VEQEILKLFNPLKPKREREREMGRIDEKYIQRGNQGEK
jgi:hypothetical protein